MKKYSKGFTLIELLVVIAIIGILSSVVLASLNSARQKSRDARRLSDMNEIQKTIALINNTGSEALVCGATVDLCTTPDLSDYVDPLNSGSNIYTVTTAGTVETYVFTFNLEAATGSLAAGAHTLTVNGVQ